MRTERPVRESEFGDWRFMRDIGVPWRSEGRCVCVAQLSGASDPSVWSERSEAPPSDGGASGRVPVESRAVAAQATPFGRGETVYRSGRVVVGSDWPRFNGDDRGSPGGIVTPRSPLATARRGHEGRPGHPTCVDQAERENKSKKNHPESLPRGFSVTSCFLS